jgi:23S rRNA C2498 (ribose-2'-O)-methylase RlmM
LVERTAVKLAVVSVDWMVAQMVVSKVAKMAALMDEYLVASMVDLKVA